MRVRIEIPDRPPARRDDDGRVGAALAELDESPGRPLPEQLRLEMEARFGSDFSDVRLHQDARADSSAETLGARAFTVGNHIFFRAGAFEPGKVDGRRLLAHELAHTLQQRSATEPRRRLSTLSPTARGAEEAHARSAAEAALTGKKLKPAARETPHIARWIESMPDDRATNSPVNPFVEDLALDVVHALQRDPDDAGAHTQRRLSRLENATRAAVIARARELLTPPEQERSAKALSGAAVVEDEQPRPPAADTTEKPAEQPGPEPDSDLEKPVPAPPTPIAAAPKPVEAAKPSPTTPTAAAAGKLTPPTPAAKRPGRAVPGAAPAAKKGAEKMLTEAAAKAGAAAGPPEFAKKLGGRPAQDVSPAAAAAQADGGDAGAQPDLGPAATLEEKADAKQRERIAKAEARAKEIEKHGVEEGEHKAAEVAHAAPAEAVHPEAVATLETVADTDAGGEPETPTAAQPGAAEPVGPEPVASTAAPDTEPPAEAEPEAAEPEAAQAGADVAEPAAAEPELPDARASEPAEPAAPEPAAAGAPELEAEAPAVAAAEPEPAPAAEPPAATEPMPAETAPPVEPAPPAEPEQLAPATEAAPAVESEAASSVRDEPSAGEEPPAAAEAEADAPAPEVGEAPAATEETSAATGDAPDTAAAGDGGEAPDTEPAGDSGAPAADGGDCGPDSAPGVGGGEGGGAAIPDPQPEPEPDVSQATPEDAMATAATLAPGPLVRTLGGVKTAAQREVAGKRDDLAANPPSIERPTGAPQTRDGRITAAVKLGGGPSPSPARPRRSQSRTPAPKMVAKQLPPPPPSPIQAVEPPRVNTATQAPMTPQEIQAFVASMGQLPVTDPGLNVTAGPPPTVDLTGIADPSQVTEKRDHAAQEVDQAARDGEQAAAEPMGENNVYPAVKPEILRAEPTAAAKPAAPAAPAAAAPAVGSPPAVAGASPVGAAASPVAAAIGAGGATQTAAAGPAAPGGADPAEIIAKEQSTAEVQAAAVGGQGQMAAGRETQESGVDKANADAQADIDKDIADNSKAQDEQRKQTLSQVGSQRSGWTKEQRDAVSKHDADSEEQMRRVDSEVTGPRDKANKDAATEIDKGNAEAAKARRDGEAKAAAAREEGKKRGHGGVLGWIADKAKAAFNWVKDRIKEAFDWARKLVRDAINRAIKFATDIIDRVRNAIVSAIRAIGDALLALGDALLSWFPSLHERYRKAIHKLVDAAVAKVDELADGLKAAVRKVLTALLNAIEAVIALYERALLAAVSFVEKAAMAVINKARAFVEMLAQWGQLIVDIASDPFQWLANLASSAKDGIKNHLWRAFKCAVKAWFRSKVEEVLGLPLTLFELLKRGGIKMAEIAHMVWEGLKAAIPGILIELAIEKIVAMIVPAAGAIMAIIDGLRAAWGTIQRIIAAFEKFFAFLKAVKLGNAGRQFAEMIAAAAIVVLDFLANFLVQKLMKPAKPIGGRLAAIGKKIMARIGQVGKVIGRGVRRAAQAVKAGVKKAAAAVRRGAAAIKQAAQKAARAVAKVAGRVGRAIKRGAGKVVTAVRKGAGRAMRAIERRFPRIARVLRRGASLVRRVRRGFQRAGRAIRRKWGRAKAWLRKKRAEYRRRREERKRRALERAQRELPPRLRGMLSRGISRARLWVTLQGYRLLYGLRVLAVRPDGENAKIVAANSPEVDLLTQIIQTRGRVLEDLFQRVAEDIMKDPRVMADAEDIMKQRRSKMGTLEAPLVLPERLGGAGAARDIQLISERGGPPPGSARAIPTSPEMEKAMREALNKGTAAPGVEFFQMAPDAPLAREAPVFGDWTPLKIKVGGVQTYQSEFKRAAPADPVAFATAVFQIQGGQTPPPAVWSRLSEAEKALASARGRLSHVEAGRATAALTSERLANYLAMTPVGEDGKPLRSFQQRVHYREQPMAGRGAPERAARTAMARGWEPTPGVPRPDRPPTPRSITQGEVHRFLQMHLKLAEDWLRIQILTDPNYFNSLEQAEKYVDEHMRGHLRSVLFAEKTSTGGEIFAG